MPGDRLRRVNEAVRQVLSDAITQDLKDPRVARVFVSVLGDASAKEGSLDGLRAAHGFLQRRIAGELRLKHTPTLNFSIDESIERGMRISELIDRELGK